MYIIVTGFTIFQDMSRKLYIEPRLSTKVLEMAFFIYILYVKA